MTVFGEEGQRVKLEEANSKWNGWMTSREEKMQNGKTQQNKEKNVNRNKK